MTHLVPYARQGLAGHALFRHHESGGQGPGLVHTRRCPADTFYASVYADRSVVVGRVGAASPHPMALAFQGYLSPDHRGDDDARRVDPSIAAILSYGGFWDEVERLCAHTPRVVESPDLATGHGEVFPDWMSYDGRQHAGYQAAMDLAFATARPFWTGPHVPTEVWLYSLPGPGERPKCSDLRLCGMRSDGLPFSPQEMTGAFAHVFLAALDVQTFWPPCCRLVRWWNSVYYIAPNTPGKEVRSGLLEWNVPKRSGHAWLSLLSQHQALADQALKRVRARS